MGRDRTDEWGDTTPRPLEIPLQTCRYFDNYIIFNDEMQVLLTLRIFVVMHTAMEVRTR
jgi:hypothetical protein